MTWDKTLKKLEAIKISKDEALEYAENIINTVREPLIVLDQDLRVVTASQSFYEFFKINPEDTVGRLVYDLGNKQWDIPKLRELLETILPKKTTFNNYEVEHDFATIGRRTMLLNARQIQRVSGKEQTILLAIEDITERKLLESLLTESEERFRRLFETASDGIVLLEKSEGKITHANPATEEMLGYTKEESIGNKLQDIGVSLDMDDFQTTMQILNKNGIINYTDVPATTKSGQHIDTDIYLVDKATLVQCNIRDITDRKRAEDILQVSEEHYRTLFNEILDGICLADAETGIIIDCNRALEVLVCRERAELIGQPQTILHPPQDDKKAFSPTFKEHLTDKQGHILEAQVVTKKGDIREVEIKANFVVLNGRKLLQGLFHDITERKQIKELLQEERETFFTTLENDPSGVALFGRDGAYKYLNPQFTNITGYTIEDVPTGKDWFQKAYPDPEYRKKVIETWKKNILSEGKSVDEEFKVTCKDGQIKDIEFRTTFLKDSTIIVLNDITERRQSEQNLKESEERYRNIFENAVEGIFQTAPGGRYISVNPALARMIGYDTPEELMEGITDLSKQGYVNPEDRTRYKEIIESEGVIQGFETQHYRKDGSIIWVSINGRAVRDTTGKVLHYEGTTENITDRKMAEEKLKQNVEKLRKSLGGTIQAMSMMVETRDPYTAGHQKKVSILARVIAQEMDLSKDMIDKIRMAGVIHDIGKLSVPAEILSKPTKLTDIEFSLIKVHPQSGYDILKGVDLPYPIAEIVYQHHERLDGSGYPQGLKDGQILLEACILAVADVVEAMASHRPYRPAKGIDMALEEIEKNKGIFYDIKAVDACVRLFREKGFTFETIAS